MCYNSKVWPISVSFIVLLVVLGFAFFLQSKHGFLLRFFFTFITLTSVRHVDRSLLVFSRIGLRIADRTMSIMVTGSSSRQIQIPRVQKPCLDRRVTEVGTVVSDMGHATSATAFGQTQSAERAD